MEWIGFKKINKPTLEYSRDVFTRNVLILRKSEGLTQQKMADRLGVKRTTIGAMEEGRAMSMEIVFNISRTFKITIDDLITRPL